MDGDGRRVALLRLRPGRGILVMREKPSDIKANQDALQREADILRETLRAVTARAPEIGESWAELAYSTERDYTDATAGPACMVATLLNPRRAHGGIVLVETYYGRKRDLDVITLDDWRSRVSRMITSGCHSAWVYVEDDIISELWRKRAEIWGRQARGDLGASGVAFPVWLRRGSESDGRRR